MDRQIHELLELGKRVITMLPRATYDELGRFVEQREEILNQMQSLKWSPQELHENREYVQEVLRQDALIVSRMKELREEAAGYMARMEASRLQRKAYDSAYDGESYFFDRRK